ncbi:TGACG-sequence-specific DNA-binding protein TGA-2.1-like [Fagus crenata]
MVQLLVNQLEPLTEQQLVGIYNLQQSSQEAEDALSQGMEALQQSLAKTLANGSPSPSGSSGNVANYMGQMAMAMGKLGTLEGFLRQVFGTSKINQILHVNVGFVQVLQNIMHIIFCGQFFGVWGFAGSIF